MDTLDDKKHDDLDDSRLAEITVDRHRYQVREGNWVVSRLKATVGVDAAKVLAKVTPDGLKDLDDGETIHVRDGQKFVSHARSGGSS